MRQVFLSSTARDLTAYREASYRAIERLDGHHCVRMEDFGARAAQANEFCRARIGNCDVAVFIIGLCYGSCPPDSDQSYTVGEYLAAQQANIPRLVFLSAEQAFYAGYYRESDELWEKQQAFRAQVNQEHIRDVFTTPEELAGKVATALSNWGQDQGEALQAPSQIFQADVRGSGAVAQGDGAVAAGAGGVAVRGSVYGDVHIGSGNGSDQASQRDLREAYLRRVMERCVYLSLAGIDPGVASQRDTDTQLSLDAVYTALLTGSPREQQDKRGEQELFRLTVEEKQRSALEQLDRYQRLVLQGDPGSGKSTFVNFVALCLAGEALGDATVNLQRLTAPLPDREGKDSQELQPWRQGALLPVPVVLRDFAATHLPERGHPASARHLWAFLEHDLGGAGLEGYTAYLKKELLQRGGLVLLDGLDEVPEAESRREQVKQAVESFVQSFVKCRVLVTSRTYAYQNQGWRLEGFTETLLAPFSDSQIRRFVSGWYAHTAGLGRLSAQDAAGRAELLKQAIFSRPTLHDLAQRPLLLTLMASLHAWRGGDLPEARERLYADAVELLLNVWEQRRLRRDAQGRPLLIQPSLAEYLKADRAKVRQVLEGLAFEAHRSQPELTGTADIAEDALAGRLVRLSGNPDASLGRLIEYLRDRAGLLYPRGVGIYTFPHRSFQEYLAACYLTGDDPERLADLARTEPDRWREVALLAGAKAARGAAAGLWQLADALCFREPTDPAADQADQWGAQIAAQILVEAADLSRVSAANRLKLEKIRRWLLRLMRSDWPATERALAGDNLAKLGDPRFDPDHWSLPNEPMLGFVEIPAGPFKMGSDKPHDQEAYENEFPQHEVHLPRYYLARWPVTVAQFAAFVQASGYQPQHPDTLRGIANHSVVYVSWHDAMAYCGWLGERLREVACTRLDAGKSLEQSEQSFWAGLAQGTLGVGLPSEAEWEKAARGADGRIYPWGNRPDPDKANYADTGLFRTTAVGCFPDGASPYGGEEMSGTVWEWTRSLWDDYPYPAEASERLAREDLSVDHSRRVVRGGACHYDSRNVRCACRHHDAPVNFHLSYGFRVVVSPFFSGR